MRRCDARCPLLAGDGRQGGDDAAAHAFGFAAAGDDRRRTVAGPAAARAEDDVDALGFELLGDFRSRFIAEFFDVAAAHEGIRFFRQGADEAFCNQFVQAVDGEHDIDVFVDIRVVEAAVGDHQVRRWRVEGDAAVREIPGRIERRLVFFMDAASRDEGDFTFTQWFL